MRLLLFLALGLGSMTACNQTQQAAASQNTSSAKQPALARTMIASGATVIDVRTAEEHAEGHLPNAHLVPIDELADRVGEVTKLVKSNKTAPIVVYCASGRRSTKAHQILSEAGFSQVVNGGGLDDLR